MSPRELIEELHRRQAEMHAGGSTSHVAELLTEDNVWARARRPKESGLRPLERKPTLQPIAYLTVSVPSMPASRCPGTEQ
jgi:hypothetical protein